MDAIVSAFRPDTAFSAFFSRSGESESGNKSPSATNQNVELPGHINMDKTDESSESTSTSSFSNEAEIVRMDDNCDNMIEKWRLIKLADKQKAQKKVADAKNDTLTRS